MFQNSRSAEMRMPRKSKVDQPLVRRTPRQARSQHKVQLILDAALEILEREDFDALTTNSLAARAGVSIGTVYQYFGDKRAIVDALTARELQGMSGGVMDAVRQSPARPGDRVRGLVTAVMSSYRGRRRAHRQLIAHAGRGGARLNPLYAAVEQFLTSPGGGPRPVSAAEAF